MDKIINAFRIQIETICNEFESRLLKLSNWQLESYVPEEMKGSSVSEKRIYCIDKFKRENPMIKLLEEDINRIRQGAPISRQLPSLNLDPRYLESLGLRAPEIDGHYLFVEKIISLLEK